METKNGWQNYLAEETDLDAVQAALVRERVIRDAMRETGEKRQHVVDMVDAMESMGQEAVLDLTEGEPTTLRDALQRYVDGLEGDSDEEVFLGRVAEELGAILAYPFADRQAANDPAAVNNTICRCTYLGSMTPPHVPAPLCRSTARYWQQPDQPEIPG